MVSLGFCDQRPTVADSFFVATVKSGIKWLPESGELEGVLSRQVHGFSLLELMVAVTVALVLLALVVPAFNDLLARNRVSSDTNLLLSAVQLGRSEAIKQNQTLVLCNANAELTACSGQAGQWQGFVVVDLADPPAVLRAGHFSDNATVSFAQPQLRFNPQGFFRTSANQPLNDQFELCPEQDGPGRLLRLWSAGRTEISLTQCGGS